MSDLEKQVNSLLKDCPESDKPRLNAILGEVMEDYEKLKLECQDKLKKLNELLEQRKKLEQDLEKCEKWLDEAQVATSIEIRKPNVGVLEEQLGKVIN